MTGKLRNIAFILFMVTTVNTERAHDHRAVQGNFPKLFFSLRF